MNTKYINVRVDDEQHAEIERLRGRIQERVGSTIKVTTKTVILEALKQLSAYYDKLDKDKKRER